VVGRPNVGKSTLVNQLVGEKVAITSARPQTTRNTIRGVLTEGDKQYVFVDTPGLHKPRNALGERLNQLVYGSLADTDVSLFVIDARAKIGPGDRLIAERLAAANSPVIVALNKVDIAQPEMIGDQLMTAAEWDFAAYVPVSARTGDGLDRLLAELEPYLAEGPFFFPPDVSSDQPDELLAAEFVREKYLSRLREELPHSLAVVVDDMATRDDGLVHIAATVYVERPSQKGMVIGKGGSMLQAVGTAARKDIERVLGAKVFLDLRVRVEKDWQRRDPILDRMGF
jgi:GTP-binding protein Era